MAHTRNFSAIREAIEAHLEQQQYDSQMKKEKGSHIVAQSKMPTQLEAPLKSKKTRSYALISSDEIFEKWEKGLCELCDELYLPGHKCKKVSSNYLIVVVEEEDDLRQPDFGVENPSSMDASQVLDESPKRDAQIKPGELVSEGQGKLLEGSEVVAGEPLDVANTRLEQASVDHLGRGTHKSSLGMVLDDDVAVTHLSYGADFSRAMEQHQFTQQEAERSDLINEGLRLLTNSSVIELGFVVEQCLTSQELELSGCEDSCDEMKVIGQRCEVWQEMALRAHRMEGRWLADRLYCSKWKNHGWKWAKSFPFILFDPGGCFAQSLQALTQPVSETVEGSLGAYEEGMKAWAEASKLWMPMSAPKRALRRYEAASWLRMMFRVVSATDLQAEPLEEEFRLGLRSGMIFSNVLHKVQPGAVQKVVGRPKDPALILDGAALSAYRYFENMRTFLVAVQEMGIPTFKASDLEQGGTSAWVVNSVLESSSLVAFDPRGKLFCFKLRPQGRNVCSAVKVVETALSRLRDPYEGTNEDQVSTIAAQMTDHGMKLECIVVRRKLSIDTDKTIMEENNRLLDLFTKRTWAKTVYVGNATSLLGAFRTGNTSPVTTVKGDLEVSDRLKIKVWVYKKNSEERFPTMEKYSDKAPPTDRFATHEIKVDYEYKSIQDPNNVVPLEQRIKGYRYGPEVVPISLDAWEAVKFKHEKGVKFLGFTDAENILHHYYMKDVSIFITEPGKTEHVMAIFALARAMKETNKVAMVRCVWRQGQGIVVIGVLTPNLSTKDDIPDSLYFNVLPFTEDVREFQFSSFRNLPAAFQPTEEQQEAADNLNFKPMVEQAFVANLRRIEQNFAALAISDVGSFTLPPGGSGSVTSSPSKLSSSAHRFNCMIQDLFVDVEPLETFQLVGALLEGLVQSFNAHMPIVTNVLAGSMNEAHQEGIGTSIVQMVETEAQQVVARLIFDPGGKMVAAYIPSWPWLLCNTLHSGDGDNNKQRNPAWVDEEEEKAVINLAKEEDETVISGSACDSPYSRTIAFLGNAGHILLLLSSGGETLENLTAKVDFMKFNHDAQILNICSRMHKSSLKLENGEVKECGCPGPCSMGRLNEDQNTTILALSLEDKALKGGALMQDFPIYTHFQLIFHFCLIFLF